MSEKDDFLGSGAFEAWPAADEILIELGRLMTVWGGLEAGLNVAIGKLAGFDNIEDVRPMILLAHSSFPQRLDNLSTLCHQLQDQFPNLRGYEEVISGIKVVQKERNKFAHQMVVKDPDSDNHVILSFSARGKVAYSEQVVTALDIRRVSAHAHIVSLKLHQLITMVTYPPIWERV